MGLAYKCDRCGDFYIYYERSIDMKKRRIMSVNALRPMVEDFLPGPDNTWEGQTPITLCQACLQEFEDFMSDTSMGKRPTIDELMQKLNVTPMPGPDWNAIKKYVPNAYKQIIKEKEAKYKANEEDK